MSTWILADPHAGTDEASDRALLSLLDEAVDEGVDLLILGDLFVGWIAVDRFMSPLIREVLSRLIRLREAGRRVTFVVGNRDFLAEELIGQSFDEVITKEKVIDLMGVPTLVAHGDRINDADWPYRTWYRLSRSGPSTTVLRHLPAFIGRRLAGSVERSMAPMNQQYQTGSLPEAALLRFGRRAAALGAERALVGHFHTDQVLLAPGGVPVVIAPDWLGCRRILVAGEENRERGMGGFSDRPD